MDYVQEAFKLTFIAALFYWLIKMYRDGARAEIEDQADIMNIMFDHNKRIEDFVVKSRVDG